MRSYQVICGKAEQIPAIGAEGLGETTDDGFIFFYPFDLTQLPCPLDEFGGFKMSQHELKELP
jgi:hypothetical protein